MFQSMVPPLLAQANHIAKHDDDLAQDIISRAFLAYNNAQNRGKDLSIGELVNLMKYRASDVRSGKRLQYGSISKKTTGDVYNLRNYLNGDVELLSLDFSTIYNECSEDTFDGRGAPTAATVCRDYSANVLFEVGFESFLKKLTPRCRYVFSDRLETMNVPECPNLSFLGVFCII
ncbi:MAG: hypothetical protein IIB44_00925 [Candidatus Marinimicrobia bacterium]|nr:hypothetical protein [Candidatus Neomarinimicrobiota bacterium]